MHCQFRGITLALLLSGLFPPFAPAATPVYQLITVAGSDVVGDGGTALTAEIDQPEGLAVDGQGNLYIADAANHRIRQVTPAGVISTIAGNGHPGYGGDNGPAASAQLNQPYGLALDSSGNLYIADFGNNRVRRIGTDGNITTVAGNGQGGSAGDGGPATSAQMLNPRNLAIDPAGNLYISEFNGHCVRMVALDGTITTVAGNGVAGYSGDGGPATVAQLAFPCGLAVDASGALYIVDSVNLCIRKVQGGIISTIVSQQQFGRLVKLSGLAADSAGNLYIPDSVSSFVWEFTTTGTLSRIAGAPGTNVSSADGGLAINTALVLPVDVTVNSGNLYISETHRVRVVTGSTGIITTVAGNGIFGFSGDGGAATQAVLNAPLGLTFDSAGNLYIADQANSRVRQLTSAGVISTVAGGGQGPTIGDGLPATSAILANPAALAFDAAGDLDIADSLSNLVRQVNPSGVIITVAGDPAATGYGDDGSPATLMPLRGPQGLAVDSASNLYIADTDHHRILIVDSSGDATTIAGTGTAGYDGEEMARPGN